MRVIMTRGCICNSLTVDKVEETHLTEEQREDVWQRLFLHLRKQGLNDVLQMVVENEGEYECSDHSCECCGDYIETYSLVI